MVFVRMVLSLQVILCPNQTHLAITGLSSIWIYCSLSCAAVMVGCDKSTIKMEEIPYVASHGIMSG